jgi:hypothetical protein
LTTKGGEQFEKCGDHSLRTTAVFFGALRRSRSPGSGDRPLRRCIPPPPASFVAVTAARIRRRVEVRFSSILAPPPSISSSSLSSSSSASAVA